MMDISIHQEGHERICLSDSGHERRGIVVIDVCVFVSLRGIILNGSVIGEDEYKNTITLNLAHRILHIGDGVEFRYRSGDAAPQGGEVPCTKAFGLGAVPKCAFHVSSSQGRTTIVDNASCDLLQFDLRCDNINDRCVMNAWSGQMLENGEINRQESSTWDINAGESVTLNIQSLTSHSAGRAEARRLMQR